MDERQKAPRQTKKSVVDMYLQLFDKYILKCKNGVILRQYIIDMQVLDMPYSCEGPMSKAKTNAFVAIQSLSFALKLYDESEKDRRALAAAGYATREDFEKSAALCCLLSVLRTTKAMVKDDAGEWQYVSDLGNPLGRFNALYHAHRFLTLSEDEALVLTRLENESEGLIYVKKAQEKGQAFALMGVLLLAHMLALMSTEDACKKKEEKIKEKER